MRPVHSLVLLALSLVSLAAAEPRTLTLANGDRRSVTVDAIAVAKAMPDKLEWLLQIRSVKPTVKASRDAVDASLQRLVAALKAAGIEEKALAVSDVDQGREVESSERKRIFKGYYASTSIRLSLTDFKLVHRVQSEVLADDLIEVKWMNQVSDHEGELRQKALADAARVALKKAEILAGTLGAKVGDVLEITETSFDRETGYGNYSSNFVQTQSMVDLGGPQEAQVSEISVRAAVNVKFELIK